MFVFFFSINTKCKKKLKCDRDVTFDLTVVILTFKILSAISQKL